MSTLDLTADVHKSRRESNTRQVLTHMDRFIARWDYVYVGLAVVCTETAPDVWDITDFPGTLNISSGGDGVPIGQDINAADFLFYGSQVYEVTGSLSTALEAAGYAVMPAFTSGFSSGFEV